MRTVSFILLFTAFTIMGYGQRYAVSSVEKNIIYMGMDNPINVLVEGYPCQSVLLSTSNGTISRDSCNYFIRPQWLGPGNVSIKIDSAGIIKQIGETDFYAHRLPIPSFKIALYGDSSYCVKEVIAAQLYARVEYTDCITDLHASLDSFTMTVIRHQKDASVTINNGTKLNDDVKSALYYLQKDDVLLFSNIWCKFPDGNEYHIDDARMTIVRMSAKQ